MHTQLFDSIAADYNRALRRHRLKKALAWIGVVALGSFGVFCLGIYLLRSGITDLALCLVVAALVAWGLWGFLFLKTRH